MNPKGRGSTSCTPANPGYYVPTPAATAQSTCTPGTFTGNTGSVSCSFCTPGSECPYSGLATPIPCARGHYSPGGNVAHCIVCAAGTFGSILGATACCECCANYFNVSFIVFLPLILTFLSPGPGGKHRVYSVSPTVSYSTLADFHAHSYLAVQKSLHFQVQEAPAREHASHHHSFMLSTLVNRMP